VLISMASGSSSFSGTSATVMGDDSSNPYFLHHEESLLMSLVKQPLTEENYHSWSRLMVIALTAKNKIGFVNGNITAPSISSPLYNAWERCNAVVLLWLCNSLSKEIAASVIYLDTAREVWLHLKERYSQNNGTRVFELHKAIASLRQDQASVISYFAKLKGLWDELMSYRPIPDCSMCSCGALKTLVDYRQHEIVMKFLMGLNDSFSNVRGRILLMDPLPPINKVYSLVVQEERLREICSVSITAHVAEPMTLAANTKSLFGSKNTARKDTPVCIQCGITGLTVDKCLN
jgi:hypothetical protein